MQRLLFSLAILFTFLASNTLLAQSTAGTSNNFITSNSNDLIVLDDSNWSFFIDEENKTYYIDFEQISFNLSDIVVKNENGDIVFTDDVLDLPVDTIYELDFTGLGDGAYQVELRSFTNMIRKEVKIK